MADHILTALKETMNLDSMVARQRFQDALSFCQFGDNVDLDTWRMLEAWGQGDNSINVHAIRASLTREWLQLGQPATSEAWQAAKYPS